MLKKLTLSAIFSDEEFLAVLVLKGGNAMALAYELTERASLDIDFSMSGDFAEGDIERVREKLGRLLDNEFSKFDMRVIDVKLVEKPGKINEAVKNFWGGYQLEFKVISVAVHEEFWPDAALLTRKALPIHLDNSSKFLIDISKFEYIEGKKPVEIDGSTVYVYSPEMIAIEKMRALCQQNAGYKDVVLSMTPKSRARDFYDIHKLIIRYGINIESPENVQLTREIFGAKKVPLEFLKELELDREFHRQSWESVKDTISNLEKLEEFDFYFDFVKEKSVQILHSLGIE